MYALHNNKTQLSTTDKCHNLNPVATAKMSKGKWYVECSIVGAKPTRMVFFAWQKENESCRRANSNNSAKQRRHQKETRKQGMQMQTLINTTGTQNQVARKTLG